jgi:hypothetical protein
VLEIRGELRRNRTATLALKQGKQFPYFAVACTQETVRSSKSSYARLSAGRTVTRNLLHPEMIWSTEFGLSTSMYNPYDFDPGAKLDWR